MYMQLCQTAFLCVTVSLLVLASFPVSTPRQLFFVVARTVFVLMEKLACSRLLYAFRSLLPAYQSQYITHGAARSERSTKPHTIPADMTPSHQYHMYKSFRLTSAFLLHVKRKAGSGDWKRGYTSCTTCTKNYSRSCRPS